MQFNNSHDSRVFNVNIIITLLIDKTWLYKMESMIYHHNNNFAYILTQLNIVTWQNWLEMFINVVFSYCLVGMCFCIIPVLPVTTFHLWIWYIFITPDIIRFRCSECNNIYYSYWSIFDIMLLLFCIRLYILTDENTDRAIQNGQFSATGYMGYTKRRKPKPKHNTICVEDHYEQANKSCETSHAPSYKQLEIKDELSIASIRKSYRI